jgi:hypothetical protein
MQSQPVSIDLVDNAEDGERPGAENVLVEYLSDNLFKVVRSPGIVSRLAAGDIFRLTDDQGHYELVSRCGNNCVQVYVRTDGLPELRDFMSCRVRTLRGWLDGTLSLKRNALVVYTFPPSVSFEELESLRCETMGAFPDVNWLYGTDM